MRNDAHAITLLKISEIALDQSKGFVRKNPFHQKHKQIEAHVIARSDGKSCLRFNQGRKTRLPIGIGSDSVKRIYEVRLAIVGGMVDRFFFFGDVFTHERFPSHVRR